MFDTSTYLGNTPYKAPRTIKDRYVLQYRLKYNIQGCTLRTIFLSFRPKSAEGGNPLRCHFERSAAESRNLAIELNKSLILSFLPLSTAQLFYCSNPLIPRLPESESLLARRMYGRPHVVAPLIIFALCLLLLTPYYFFLALWQVLCYFIPHLL